MAFAVRPWLVTAVFAFAVVSEAGEIPVVKLSPEGPLSTFPATGAFYLEGDSVKTARVRAVFVRTRAGAFGSSPSCESVSAAVEGRLLRDGKSFGVFQKPSKRYPPNALWQSPPAAAAAEAKTFAELDSDSVFLPPVWAGAADAKTYKILVDQPAFFRPGSQHCLFIYREKEDIKSLDTEMGRLVLDGAASYLACEQETDSGKKNTCEAVAKDALFAKLKESWKRLDVKVQDEATLNVRNRLWGTALNLLRSGPMLQRDFAAWRAVLGSPLPGWDGSLRPIAADTPQAVTAWLLVREAALQQVSLPVVVDGKVTGRRPAFYTKQGAEVLRIGVAADKNTLQIAGAEAAPPAGAMEPLKVDPASLRFPHSAVSLRDVLHFLEGRVRWGSGFQRLEDVGPEVQRIVAKGATLNAEERKRLEELRDQLIALAALLSDERNTPPLEELRGWAGRLIAGCTDANRGLLAQAGVPCPDTAAGETAEFFGFISAQESLFHYMVNHLRNHLQAVDAWNRPGGEGVEMHEFVLAEIPPAIRVPVAIEHPTFVTQLVTPVMGHTWIPLADRTGSLFTLGFQLSLRPNPVEQPMWTNGREDLGRLVALELGIGLKSGFDPRGRAKGLGVLAGAPAFVGLALRPLPYVSFSGGAAVVTNQRSVLGVEQRSVGLAPYFNVSAQVNALDALRAAYSDSVTSVAKVVP